MLDEATSHLDIFNEHRIVKAISELRLTPIIVAHRKETIDGAGSVIALGQLQPPPNAKRISPGTPEEKPAHTAE